MSLAGEFRDLYTPNQPTPAQANAIGSAVVKVSMRFLDGIPDMHPEAKGQFPLLTRTAELLDQFAANSAANEYGYVLPEATDRELTPEELATEFDLSWFNSGFMVANSRFAATIAEIALDHSKVALRTALQESYDENRINRAVESVTQVQYDALHSEEMTHEWSANFPGFVVIATELYDTRPAYHKDNLAFNQGFYEGVHFYPSALGRFALADEMPQL
jgi:hypothetical protein